MKIIAQPLEVSMPYNGLRQRRGNMETITELFGFQYPITGFVNEEK